MSITENGMLINLQLGSWTAFKLDKRMSAESAHKNDVKDDKSIRVNKRIIAEEAIKQVEQARNAVRTNFYAMTLAWSDNGDRLLPRMMYLDFMAKHTPLEEAFYEEVRKFHAAYAENRDRAQFQLAAAFNPADYPHPDEIKRKFYCRMDISPLPTADDFRVNLGNAELNVIKDQIEAKTMDRIQAAQAEVIERIEKVVTNAVERMDAQVTADPEKRLPPLHQSTFDNMIELVNMLPKLNITGDPNVKATGKRLHKLLSSYNEADELKGKPDECQVVKDELEEILADMAGYAKGAASI